MVWQPAPTTIYTEDLTNYQIPLKHEQYSYYEDKLTHRNNKSTSVSHKIKHKHRGKKSSVTSERYNLTADRLSSFEKEYSPYDAREDMFYHGRECWCGCGYYED